jgi:hypothetical protein
VFVVRVVGRYCSSFPSGVFPASEGASIDKGVQHFVELVTMRMVFWSFQDPGPRPIVQGVCVNEKAKVLSVPQ